MPGLPRKTRDLLAAIADVLDIPRPAPGFWQSQEDLRAIRAARLLGVIKGTLQTADITTIEATIRHIRQVAESSPATYPVREPEVDGG